MTQRGDTWVQLQQPPSLLMLLLMRLLLLPPILLLLLLLPLLEEGQEEDVAKSVSKTVMIEYHERNCCSRAPFGCCWCWCCFCCCCCFAAAAGTAGPGCLLVAHQQGMLLHAMYPKEESEGSH